MGIEWRSKRFGLSEIFLRFAFFFTRDLTAKNSTRKGISFALSSKGSFGKEQGW